MHEMGLFICVVKIFAGRRVCVSVAYYNSTVSIWSDYFSVESDMPQRRSLLGEKFFFKLVNGSGLNKNTKEFFGCYGNGIFVELCWTYKPIYRWFYFSIASFNLNNVK